ncbi:hypothetical protein F183_A24720 [Bryobacterales bacterium F-183]|nr:hypothetical protein F183_A24720 [Bryobacterales bacterium F-183]
MAYLEYVHVQPRSENLLLVLGKALDFSASDLLENRKGTLSHEQFDRLSRTHVYFPLLAMVITLITPMFLRIAWLYFAEDRGVLRFLQQSFSDPGTIARGLKHGIEEPLPVLFWVVLCIFPLAFIHYSFRMPWPLFLDLVSRKVKKETGLASNRWAEHRLRGRKGREGDLISRYDYIINEKRFQVSRAAFEALAPSLEYNLYYLPRTRTVVSIEPLEAAAKNFDPGSKGFDAIEEKRKEFR